MSNPYTALCSDIFDAYVLALRDRQQNLACGLAGALVGLGRQNYVAPGQSYNHPSTLRRRAKVLDSVRSHPLHERIRGALEDVGVAACGQDWGGDFNWACPQMLCDISPDGHIRFGVEHHTSHLVDAWLAWSGDFLRLDVFDEADFSNPLDKPASVASVTLPDGVWHGGHATLAELALTDDDYRLQVGLWQRNGYPAWMAEANPARYGGPAMRMGHWFDFAEVDGIWTQLKASDTGWQWDGETEHSTRTHQGTEPVHIVRGAQEAQQEQQTQEQEQQAQQQAQQEQYADLIATIRGYAAETHHGQAHVDRWRRTLKALGDDNAVSRTYTRPMTADEAHTYADKGWKRWEPVVEALRDLEARQ